MKPDVVLGLLNAGWPVLLLDEKAVIHHANPAAVQIFGEAAGAGSTPLATFWPAENSGSPEEFLLRAQRSPGVTLPVKLVGEGGISLSRQACVSSFLADGGKWFLVQLLTPATPAHETKSPLVDSNLAQKQKLDCALQLARTVSLDFNNALTIILGHTSLVLSKMEPDNPWRASLMEVEKSAARASEIANDLAAFSRNEKESKVQLAGNLNHLLQRNIEMFQSMKLGKDITWNVRLERKLFMTAFDEAKMQQAFVKIMENAVEALGDRGSITVVTKNVELTQPTQDRNVQLVAGAYVCAEISDTGCGIEPDVLPRIFEPFFTTKRGGKHRGLGLAWVYGIVTNHGGGVAVSSQPGVGTSVRVYLPADKKIVKDDGHIGGDLTGTQTVLMVDDEDLLLTLGQTILSAYGYKVLTANSGQRAVEILSKNDRHIDLIITDLVMPSMTGRELMEHIVRLSPATRILCTSGYVRPSSEESHGIGYIQKPFTSRELLMKVKAALAASGSHSVD